MRLGKTKLAVATGGNVQQSKHRASVYSSRNMHFCTCPAAKRVTHTHNDGQRGSDLATWSVETNAAPIPHLGLGAIADILVQAQGGLAGSSALGAV